jgi:hypothetical protein
MDGTTTEGDQSFLASKYQNVHMQARRKCQPDEVIGANTRICVGHHLLETTQHFRQTLQKEENEKTIGNRVTAHTLRKRESSYVVRKARNYFSAS